MCAGTDHGRVFSIRANRMLRISVKSMITDSSWQRSQGFSSLIYYTCGAVISTANNYALWQASARGCKPKLRVEQGSPKLFKPCLGRVELPLFVVEWPPVTLMLDHCYQLRSLLAKPVKSTETSHQPTTAQEK